MVKNSSVESQSGQTLCRSMKLRHQPSLVPPLLISIVPGRIGVHGSKNENSRLAKVARVFPRLYGHVERMAIVQSRWCPIVRLWESDIFI